MQAAFDYEHIDLKLREGAFIVMLLRVEGHQKVLWCQPGICRAFQNQEGILFVFLPGAPGAFELGSDNFNDVVAVHMGPFEEHAGALDYILDVFGKLIEFFPAVVQAPGDGFVDFEPGVVFCGAV